VSYEIQAYTLPNGNRLLLVETSGSGGGKWGRPGYLNLVELAAGTEFRGVSCKNVARVIDRRDVDTRHTGPRSSYYRELADIAFKMARLIDQSRPSVDVPAALKDIL